MALFKKKKKVSSEVVNVGNEVSYGKLRGWQTKRLLVEGIVNGGKPY